MGAEETSAIPIYVGGLDGTMARSVQAFLEARHAEHFTVVGRDQAAVMLVDLDQPHAQAEIDAATPTQVLLGVGFDAEARMPGCRRYVQKPLNGAVLTDALSEAVALVGAKPRAERRPIRLDRPSHARDVFTKGTAYERPTVAAGPVSRTVVPPTTPTTPLAPAAAAAPSRPPAPRFERGVHERTPRIIDVADEQSSSATAAEALGRRMEVEQIEARSGGDLHQPSVLDTYRYSPSLHLDGRLRLAVERHGDAWWELRSPLLSLFGDPTDGSIALVGSDSRLRHCCAAPLDDTWQLGLRRRPPDLSTAQRVPRAVMLWNTAVWCSRGRLADSIDPFSATSVRAWPDLTRVALTPGALPIIALLTISQHRPVDVPDLLGLPRTHVFVVLSALDNLRLVEGPASALGVAALATDAAAASAGRHGGADRGVLRRLIGRLRDQ